MLIDQNQSVMKSAKFKARAALFSIMLLGIVLSPILENWRAQPQDSFPLSYYPMFSKKREATYTLRYLVGYDSAQSRYHIPYRYIGNGGFNQVRRQINKQCKRGKSKKLARKVARRLSKCQEAPFNQLDRVEVVKGTYHFATYFEKGDKRPLEEKVLCTQKILEP